ncbi:MAG TPA: hypothetical protein V6C65_40830 [Allocoleopsis sp.]
MRTEWKRIEGHDCDSENCGWIDPTPAVLHHPQSGYLCLDCANLFVQLVLKQRYRLKLKPSRSR